MAARCALPGVQAATDPAAHSVSASVLGVVPTWGSRLADPGRHGDAVMAPARGPAVMFSCWPGSRRQDPDTCRSVPHAPGWQPALRMIESRD